MTCPTCSYKHCNVIGCGSCGWKPGPNAPEPVLVVADEVTDDASSTEEPADPIEEPQSVQGNQSVDTKKARAKVPKKAKLGTVN